jgi:hypothetical protein
VRRKEGHPLVIEQIGRGQRALAVRELGKGDFAVRSTEGLLVNPTSAL